MNEPRNPMKQADEETTAEAPRRRRSIWSQAADALRGRRDDTADAGATDPARGMRLCIFGSRTLHDERVQAMIHAAIDEHKPALIVTAAETGGVCKEARIAARARSIPLLVHFLDFKFRAGAFDRRSKRILADCDFVVLIHDGQSHGTSNELKMTRKLQLPHSYHVLAVEELHEDPRSRESQCMLFE